jgi:hypothetical protein
MARGKANIGEIWQLKIWLRGVRGAPALPPQKIGPKKDIKDAHGIKESETREASQPEPGRFKWLSFFPFYDSLI